MLHREPKPDILDLLEKIQEVTTPDVDEERGSFKKGDQVTYNMLGGSLSNSDLNKTLGVDEHTLRIRHDGTKAEIVEAMGEKVARYSLQFADGFIINDVAVSEIKAITEVEEDIHVGATVSILQGGHKGEKGKVVDFILQGEDPDFDEEGGQVDVKLESGIEIHVPTFSVRVEESKLKEGRQEYIDKCVKVFKASGGTVQQKIAYMKTKGATDNEITQALDTASGGEVVRSALDGVGESKTNEAEDATQTMKPQEKPALDVEDLHMEDYSDVDLNKQDAKVVSKSEKSGDAIRAVEDKELEQEEDKVEKPKNESKVEEGVPEKHQLKTAKDILKMSDANAEANAKLFGGENKKAARAFLKKQGWSDERIAKLEESKLEEDEIEVAPSKTGIKKISDDKLKELHAGSVRSWNHWKDSEEPDKGKLAAQAVKHYEDEMVIRGLKSEDQRSEGKFMTEKVEFSFMKKQNPLWLCNECYKTFRANECSCTFCDSTDADKIGEGYGDLAGSTKEVFQVTWTEDGKEESTRMMAFDKDDAKREVERNPKKKVTKIEGPITSESKKETKPPFEQVSEGSELQENVSELVGETPGIDVEDQKILRWALEKNSISNEWPTDEDMIDQLSGGDKRVPEEGAEDVDGLDLGNIRASYVKYVLLPKATAAYEKSVSESEVTEMMTQEGIPKAGKSYTITQTTGRGFKNGVYKVTDVQYLTSGRGDLAKQFQYEGNDNWWIAAFYHFKEVDGVEEAKKEVKPFRTVEIVRSQVDSDVFNIRVVELPKGDIMIVDTEPTDKLAIAKGKEIANLIKAKFLGIIDEAKLPQRTSGKSKYTVSRKVRRGKKPVKKSGDKLKEQEEDTFTTVGKGMEKEDAEKLAQEKDGQVVTDEDNPEKFAVITKEA